MKKQFEKPELKEISPEPKIKIEDKIIKLLDMGIIKEDNSVVFTEESKALISEISEFSKKTGIYKANIKKGKEYASDQSPEDLFLDMVIKCAEAPTFIHAISSVHLLIPFIDEKLKEGV